MQDKEPTFNSVTQNSQEFDGDIDDDQDCEAPLELSAETLASMKPGDIIPIGGKARLEVFEDLIQDKILPWWPLTGYGKKWLQRTPLGDVAQPEYIDRKKFYGQIKDIQMEVMDNAGQRLFDAAEPKPKSNVVFLKPEKLPFKRTDALAAAIQESTIGFNLTARLKSSADLSGKVTTQQIWYTATNTSALSEIRRSATKPEIIDAPTTKSDQTQQMGEVATRAMRGGVLSRALPDRPRRSQPKV